MAEEVVDLDWIRATREGDSYFLMEARFRVNGGAWVKKMSWERKPFLWLTPRVGFGFQLTEPTPPVVVPSATTLLPAIPQHK